MGRPFLPEFLKMSFQIEHSPSELDTLGEPDPYNSGSELTGLAAPSVTPSSRAKLAKTDK
jgi:hypothetical protein